MIEQAQIEAGIASLEALRATLGDAVVDLAVAPLRARLAALQGPAEQQLRQVTVLFLDIVGSTAMGQRLDPEDTHAIMDGALAKFAGVVEAHRGRVLRFMGDGLLAAFGADGAREDDAERGVRAGLALLEEAAQHAADVQARHGIEDFAVRVGVHTGAALLGGGVEGENTAMGQTVNIAARMEQTAPPGGLRISHGTYRHVRGVFDVSPQPPLVVKGSDEPLVTYLVQRAKARAFRVPNRGLHGIEAAMVGRGAELQRLQHAFDRLLAERRLALVTLVAEAGLGKSRLMQEFLDGVELRPEACLLFQGRAHPQTAQQPYGLLRDILARRLQIDDGDTMSAARHRLEAALAPLFADEPGPVAEGHAHILGHLIGLDYAASRHVQAIINDGPQMRQRGFHAAAQVFRRLSALDGGTPVLLLLDDLHFADDPSLDFLAFLAQAHRDAPVLLLATTRPTLFERSDSWRTLVDAHDRIDLAALDVTSSTALAKDLLKPLDALPQDLLAFLIGQADGNPFYLEELVQMLIDQGAIDTRGAPWSIAPARLRLTELPQTLTGVVQSRLDELRPNEKLALQQASVIGMVFWDRALAAVDGRALDALPDVVRRELVVARGDRPEEDLHNALEYAFRHQILHQVTYGTVLKPMRREVHAVVGAWLAGLTGARAADYCGLAAEHFEKAGDAARAVDLYLMAAQRADKRFAVPTVVAHVASALKLLPEDANELRWRLLELRERALALRGQRVEQRADLVALERVADALDDDAKRADVAIRLTLVELLTNGAAPPEAAARRAIALAERAGEIGLRLQGQLYLARATDQRGDVTAALALAHEARDAARAHGRRREEILAENTLAVMGGQHGMTVLSLRAAERGLALTRLEGNRRAEANALVNVGAIYVSMGSPAGRDPSETGLALMRSIGHRAMQQVPLVNLCTLSHWEGRTHEARLHGQAALDTAVEVHAAQVRLLALHQLGWVELADGALDAAQRLFEQTHELAPSVDPHYRFAALAGLARVALGRGDAAEAVATVEPLLAEMAAFDGGTEQHLIRHACWQVLAEAHDPRASAMLTTAVASLQTHAASIDDAPLRHSFLTRIPHNRALIDAARGAAPPR